MGKKIGAYQVLLYNVYEYKLCISPVLNASNNNQS